MAARVTAALVVAHTTSGVQHLYAGDIVPSSVTEASLENLRALGFITDEPDASAAETDRPAESGPGSAKDKWLAYAASKGVDVSADAAKEEIIAAVTAAGH